MSKRFVLTFALVLAGGVFAPVFAQGTGAESRERGDRQVVDHHCRVRAGYRGGARRARPGQGGQRGREAIASNPGAAGDVRGALILGLVLIESLVIYVLLISLLLFFFKPFGG